MISLADFQARIEQGALLPDAAIGQSLEAIRAQDNAIGACLLYTSDAADD